MLLQYGIVSGLVFATVIVGYGFFFRWAHLEPAGLPLAMFYVFIVVAAVTPLPIYAAGAESPLTVGSGILLGSVSSSLAAMAYALFVFWYNLRVDDGLLVKTRRDEIAKVRSRDLTEEESTKRIRRVEKATQPGPFALQVFVGLALLGAVSSAVAAALLA